MRALLDCPDLNVFKTMPTKPIIKKAATKKAATKKIATKQAAPANASRAASKSFEETYQVVLRTQGKAITATVEDRILYPKALAWNRLLSSEQNRYDREPEVERKWRTTGLDAIIDLAKVLPEEVHRFIQAAAQHGVVQVEIPWNREDVGWAARVFPWENLLALATKEARDAISQQQFTVVRYLTHSQKGDTPATCAKGVANFFVTAAAENAGFDYKSEHAAVKGALKIDLDIKRVGNVDELERLVKANDPKIVHLVLNSAQNGDAISGKESFDPMKNTELIGNVAGVVARHGPELVAFSSCHTGRRLAPMAVAYGARAAVGFHGEVWDASIPVFFGAFYRALQKNDGALAAMRAGLEANRRLENPSDLGTVTLWSAIDLLKPAVGVVAPPLEAEASEMAKAKGDEAKADQITAGKIADGPPFDDALYDALPVICEVEQELNYSVLHHSRGGLFNSFVVTKVRSCKHAPLEVRVKLDTGLDRPAECRFFTQLEEKAPCQKDLAVGVTLPLGSQLLRQRGEIMIGTVEVEITCNGRQVFHKLQSIKLLPCDEWRDRKESGRHLLPAFVFPRDPAVRDILSAAQPFLRALCDRPQAGFDGYQAGFNPNPSKAVSLQTQAIWAALQHAYRLDYVNPPPTYAERSQRLRIPEEILRARRGTCIELALLLASCWEHVGILPVIFLSRGHAFAGYWCSEAARSAFFEGLKKLLAHARSPVGDEDKSGGMLVRKDVREPWMLAEPHHLSAIRAEVQAGGLVPVEATFIPFQRPFSEAVEESNHLLRQLRPYIDSEGKACHEFDGMLDVQTARDKGVTPLPIITQGVVA